MNELNRQHGLIEKYGCDTGTATDSGFFLRVESSNRMCFGVLNNCVDYSKFCGDTVLQSHTTYHIGISYSQRKIRIYLNGTNDFSVSEYFEVGEHYKLKIGCTPLVLGARGNDFGEKFKGIFKDVKIWSVARSEEYFKESAFVEYSGKELALVAWWSGLDKPCRTDLPSTLGKCAYLDQSVNENHLSLYQGLWNNLELNNWEFCCFWWGPDNAYKGKPVQHF